MQSRATQAPTRENNGQIETVVLLVGQASCLSFVDRHAGCLSHHFRPKYVTAFMKRSTYDQVRQKLKNAVDVLGWASH